MNKTIHRSDSTTRIFDHRSLQSDYSTLVPVLKEGLRVLDVGCGTGSISRGIAERVGKDGWVTGIDNTEKFILSGKQTYGEVSNLELIHADLFDFRPDEKFDLVVAARVLQWLSDPVIALARMASFLKPGGQISVLDYNHEALSWEPEPPQSMRKFYDAFLKWRADAGMDNRIAEHLRAYFSEVGCREIEEFDADEVYRKGQDDFLQRVGIWLKVAELSQIVEEGYLEEDDRLKAIEDYSLWMERDAECMIMKLKEVRGRV
ncbi:MAG TPA: methyltransferase domain-containing protein [Chryseosolibacter sp.]